jgi:hypothetical protein
MVEILARPAVLRRLARAPNHVAAAFQRRLDVLSETGPVGPPDREVIWRRAFAEYENHRHMDLPDGWRMGYTNETRKGLPSRIVVVFLGTHKEYERKYGFRTQ